MIIKFDALRIAAGYGFIQDMTKLLSVSKGKKGNAISIDDETFSKLVTLLNQIRDSFLIFDLGKIDLMYTNVFTPLQKKDRNQTLLAVGNLFTVVTYEFMSANCYVLPRFANRYADDLTFVNSLSPEFEDCSFDLTEAQYSIACGRNTAAVFHCLCVLEKIWPFIENLAKSRGVNWNAGDSLEIRWKQANDQLDAAIKARDNAPKNEQEKLQLQELSQISVYMRAVRLAWRNPTMHARGQFSYDVAAGILESIKIFISYMTSLNKETTSSA